MKANTRRISIFLVDDDQEDQMLFCDAIRELDPTIQIYTADNGLLALDALNREPVFQPDYIFIDLNMPLMDGLECLAAIKRMSTHAHIPIVIYSTSAYDKDMERTKQLGATHYIVKPFDFQELKAIVKQVLAL